MSTLLHYQCISSSVYNIITSDLRQIADFLQVTWFPSPVKTDHNDINEILLKVALNTITLNHPNIIT